MSRCRWRNACHGGGAYTASGQVAEHFHEAEVVTLGHCQVAEVVVLGQLSSAEDFQVVLERGGCSSLLQVARRLSSGSWLLVCYCASIESLALFLLLLEH